MTTKEMEDKAWQLRKKIVEVCYKTQAGHMTSALSCVEVLAALYYGGLVDPREGAKRSRFVMSKGHASIIQYIILADIGVIPEAELWRYCKPGGMLGAHPDCLKVPGVEASTGSLGHGFSIALGMALAARQRGEAWHSYVLLGDGECEEGSIWEAALCAGHHKLENLTVIVDSNKLQASDFTEKVSTLEPFPKKWEAFGFETREIDGHNMAETLDALKHTPKGKPYAIISRTVKGRGCPTVEGMNGWHCRRPNDAEWPAIKEGMGI